MRLSGLQIGLNDNLTPIVGGSLDLNKLRLSVLMDHLHRSVARLHQLAQLQTLGGATGIGLNGLSELLALRAGHDLIGADELGMTVVGDDHLRSGWLNGLLVDVIGVVVNVLTKRLLDLQLMFKCLNNLNSHIMKNPETNLDLSVELFGQRERMEDCRCTMMGLQGRVVDTDLLHRFLHNHGQTLDVLTQLRIGFQDTRLKGMRTTDLVNTLNANLVWPSIGVVHL